MREYLTKVVHLAAFVRARSMNMLPAENKTPWGTTAGGGIIQQDRTY